MIETCRSVLSVLM